MPDHADADGLAIARSRIAAEKERRTGFLDLGHLGLAQLPEELFDLEHLRGLNWGFGWRDELGNWHAAESGLAPNQVTDEFARLQTIPGLTHLSMSDPALSELGPLAGLTALRSLDCFSTQVADLGPLAGLTALQSLSCYLTQVADLGPLAGLAALQSLDCAHTQVTDLGPLAGLTALQSLDCSGTQVTDLGPLAGLTALRSLDCSGTQVTDLGPLAGLTALRSLLCYNTQFADLGPLAGLTALRLLLCYNTQFADLGPLAGLTALQSLDCSGTKVADLGPLAGLAALQSLDCAHTQVADLGPLAGLAALQSLDCAHTQVADLGPLAGLAALQSLDCAHTQVTDLGPLAGLTALRSLDCSGTQVTDLGPLAGLAALQSLDCAHTQVVELPTAFVWLDSLQHLSCHNTRIADIPAEVLSSVEFGKCLESLRAHLLDLEAGSERLTDVKALVLGNGRIGKTQICRRLRGEEFEGNADSTHGILVTSASLPIPGRDDGARLHLWDFGGQDLYHGTHALFMRTRSLFVLVWTTQSENAKEHQHRGMTFRNHPLAYWLEYVRHLSGVDSPLLIVQNMCDRPEDESRHAPVKDAAVRAFSFRKELHYSAANDRGRATLDEALREAIEWLWERTGQARIGKGRMAVKRKLEAMRDEDAGLPIEQRKYRTVTKEHFRQLCDDAGGVSRPEMLLDYLHLAGVVFYRKGLFDDRIVLDQGWALEAVYAVFHREKCYRQLRQLRGRFTRSLLDALVWQEYGVEEQRLFLSLMTSCGICFVHRRGDQEGKRETEYIAPDLLPGREEVAAEIEAMWGDGRAPAGELAVVLPFLHPGVMRGIISRFGQMAGISAVYWKYGVCLYETTTRSHALIEQRLTEGPDTWGGRIAVATRGGQAFDLLDRLRTWIVEELQRSGCRDWSIEPPADPLRPTHAPTAGRGRPPVPEPQDATPAPNMTFTPPPSDGITYWVSYAWTKESKAVADRICEAATTRGIKILRDTTEMSVGESIAKFMERLGAGDQVLVVLSDAYLKSPNCMKELLEVWINCKRNLELFRGRIRVFPMPDARITTMQDRLEYAIYWKAQLMGLDTAMKEHGVGVLGESGFRYYAMMMDFTRHVMDMISLIADTLLPEDLEQFMEYGFNDPVPPSPLP